MQPWDWLAVLLSFAAIGWFVRVMLTGEDERAKEDAAREHFDRTGRWPDEE